MLTVTDQRANTKSFFQQKHLTDGPSERTSSLHKHPGFYRSPNTQKLIKKDYIWMGGSQTFLLNGIFTGKYYGYICMIKKFSKKMKLETITKPGIGRLDVSKAGSA